MAAAKTRLNSLTLQPLPLGSILPAGWLQRQLRIQADGLSGHLDEFWPDVAQSGWIGGPAEGWERGPYWLDGVVPLAFLLNDDILKAKVQRWVNEILARQHEDGWLGPIRSDSQNHSYPAYDPWPTMVALKALTQYYDATGDRRVPTAIERNLRCLAALLAQKPLFEWSESRWADLVLTIHWLHDRTGGDWLLDLAALVHAQGYDWRAHFADFRWTDKISREQAQQSTHVVNNAMAIKAGGVWYRQSRLEEDRQASYQAMAMLDAHHGQATGIFAGDEHYAGQNPSQGTELCAVNEYLFSLETLLAILGDTTLADRLERIAFNALPAPFSPDMWAHQYDQQANQVICCTAEDRIYTTNGPDSNIFGLEPDYGCCTANLSQGWPKFTTHLWMATPDGGLAAVAYAPSQVSATVGGRSIRVDLATDYPFGETLTFNVHSEQPVVFPLKLRIPAWAEGAHVRVNDGQPVTATPGTFREIARTWHDGDTVTLHMPMRLTVERRYHDGVTLRRGPLVFSLKIGEDWRMVRGELPHADWEIWPTTPWNYALEIDPEHPESFVQVEHQPVCDYPFSPDGAPIHMKMYGRRVPAWTIEHNAAGSLPYSPVTSDEPLEELTLIPYGCTNLRVSEFPLLEQHPQQQYAGAC